jgi:hypothetical protein
MRLVGAARWHEQAEDHAQVSSAMEIAPIAKQPATSGNNVMIGKAPIQNIPRQPTPRFAMHPLNT